MQAVLQNNNHILLRFDKGDEVIEGLAKFMTDQNISACVFEGIGSAYELELGFYNQHLKDYRKRPFYEEVEIVSLIGNGVLTQDKAIIHAHGIFSRIDFSLIGGHVFKMLVLATCEAHLTKLEGPLQRRMNPDFNLNLLA